MFYDVTTGDNSVPCSGGSLNCSTSNTSAVGVLQNTAAGAPSEAWLGASVRDMTLPQASVLSTQQNLANHWASARLDRHVNDAIDQHQLREASRTDLMRVSWSL